MSSHPAPGLLTRKQAQDRIDRIESFRQELAEVQADRALELTRSQLSNIAVYHETLIQELTTLYGADASVSTRQLSFGMRLVSLVGAFSLGTSVFLIFYHF